MFTGQQLGGEGCRLSFGKSHDRLVQTLDQLAGADLVGKAFGPTVRDILSGHQGREVDRDEVAGLSRPLHAREGAEPGAQAGELSLHILISNLHRIDRDRELRQIGQVDIGTDVDLGGEYQFLAVGHPGDFDVRLTQWPQLLGAYRLAVASRQRVINHLLEHRCPADPGFEQLGRCLAGPETGQSDLLGELLIGPVEFPLQFVERHLHIDANPGGAQFLDGALHAGTPVLRRLRPFSGVCGAGRVGVTGFEPAAFRSQSGCATKLRYTPLQCSLRPNPTATRAADWNRIAGRRYIWRSASARA